MTLSASYGSIALASSLARPLWPRIVAGGVLGMLTVAVQSMVFRDAPIHFAPSLFALALTTLHLGNWAGVASLVTSTILVNYAILYPRWAWSLNSESIGATFVFLLMAAVLVAVIGPLRQRLNKLELTLDRARNASEVESRLRIEAERDFQKQLTEMQERCEKVIDLAQSAASISRYADTVAKRLSVVCAAINHAPATGESREDANGIPVISATGSQLIDLTDRQHSSLQHTVERVVMLDGGAFPESQHPLLHATRGAIVYGQRVGWMESPGSLTQVSLYATAVLNGRLLAVAIAPPGAQSCEFDPSQLI